MSTCTGAFLLGRAGLLDGRKCTTHWKRLAQLQAAHPRAEVVGDRLFIEDGAVTTSGGQTCGIDLALSLVEGERGPFFASRVARELVLYLRRDRNHAQTSVYLDFRDHWSPGIHALQDWMIDHQDRESGLAQWASVAGMSPRNLTRAFKAATGISPGEFRTLLRLERAGTLLKDPRMTVEEVAASCGFKDARSLRHLWSRRHGFAPRSAPARS